MGKSPSVPEKFIIKEEKIMAKKAIYTRIMEGLAAAGINDVTKEKAIELRVQFKVKEDQVDDFCKKYAEEHKQEEAVEATACDVGESIPLFEGQKTTVDPRILALAQTESDPANAENQDFVETELAAEDEANGADAVGATIGEEETCAVTDSIMPVGPLAQNPLANVTTKPDVVPAAVKEEAKKLEIVGTTWGELAEKFPDGKIPGFNLSLACTAELRHRKDEARMKDPNCEFWKLRALSREEIYDMLWRRGAEYNWLRDAALGKTQENKKPNIDRNWKDAYDKFDIVLRDHKLRIWVDKNKPEPEGMVYVNDQADHPFLRFRWGFKRDGMSFPLPNVKRKVPGANKYESVENFEDVAEAIKKVLVSKGYIPKRSPGTVKPGITMQNWGCRVI